MLFHYVAVAPTTISSTSEESDFDTLQFLQVILSPITISPTTKEIYFNAASFH
jgi:hypothetical protein